MNRVDYAGPGGACEGLRMLGLTPVGIEWDAAACATRAAAGHLTIRADLATYRPHHAPGSVEGYWSSPPCQTFSAAGKGDGLDDIPRMVAAIHAEDWAVADELDPRTRHVIDAARTAMELRPEWVAMEQVPAVLPMWRALCHVLERHGYSTWCGVLNSADYGVPQKRKRAILMASRVRRVAQPVPTHAERPGMFGDSPWVSMADALGWPACWELSPGLSPSQPNRRLYGMDEPAPTVAFGHDAAQWIVRSGSTVNGGDLAERTSDEPAFTVTSRADLWVVDRRQSGAPPVSVTEPAPTMTCAAVGKGVWQVRHQDGPGSGVIRLTTRDALILQSFPPDYPVQGTKTKQFEQIGNAVPPLLAAHVVAALTGYAMKAAA